jgi:hypothetical protein
MTEQYGMPEETRSAMTASRDLLLESERPDASRLSGASMEGILGPIGEIFKKDPETNRALAELTSKLESMRSQDAIDIDTLRTAPTRLLHPGAPFHIREAPFDYADKDGGNASMSPNATAGTLSFIGKAGDLVSGSQGDVVGGGSWTGNAVTNESVGSQPLQRVRVSALFKWTLFWDLLVAGIPDALVGSDPWANCRVGVNMSAWDGAGNRVANMGPRELFFRHHSGAPGPTTNKVSGAESGIKLSDLRVFFSIPAGQIRWVNLDAYFELKTRYSSVWNLAGAIGSYQVEVLSFVSRPAEPWEE